MPQRNTEFGSAMHTTCTAGSTSYVMSASQPRAIAGNFGSYIVRQVQILAQHIGTREWINQL